jgi:uncharacterized OB-fold protein
VKLTTAEFPLPVPAVDDPDTAGFFAAAAAGHLAIRQCLDCGADLHAPRASCSGCGGTSTRWRPLEGTGRLYSWTTVEHGFHPAFPVPYTVVLVEPDDAPGVRLVGCVPGRLESPRPGMPMQAVFDDVRDGVVVPQWRVSPSAAGPAARGSR